MVKSRVFKILVPAVIYSGPLFGLVVFVAETTLGIRNTMTVQEFVNFLLVVDFQSVYLSSHPQNSPGCVILTWLYNSISFVFMSEG